MAQSDESDEPDEPDERILTDAEYRRLKQMAGLDEELTEMIELFIHSNANDMGPTEVRGALQSAADGLKWRIDHPDSEHDLALKQVNLEIMKLCTNMREEHGWDWATICEGLQLAGEMAYQNQREEYGKKQGRAQVYEEIAEEYNGDVETWWDDHQTDSVWGGTNRN